ncbi:MAG: hypothetical protein ACT4QG_08275 [Sporichthyaceae bacterium]
MRVSRLVVAVAAAAILLPAGMASMAMADDVPAPGGATSAPKEADPAQPPEARGHGPRGLTDEQRTCMEGKGFGKPDFKPGERPSREDLQKRREEFEKRREAKQAAAKECGLPERAQFHRGPGGPGGFGGHGGRMHRRGPQLTDEQRSCLQKEGFGKPEFKPGERPKERPSREEMAQQRSQFEAAATKCGVTMPERRGPSGPDGPGTAPEGSLEVSPEVAPAGANA